MKQFPISKTVTQRSPNQHLLVHRDRGWSEAALDLEPLGEQQVPHAECRQPVPRGINYARWVPSLAGRSQGR